MSGGLTPGLVKQESTSAQGRTPTTTIGEKLNLPLGQLEGNSFY